VRHLEAAFTHHRDQIAKAWLETQVPADAQGDDLLVEVPIFEQLLNRHGSRHLSIISDTTGVCTRARQP